MAEELDVVWDEWYEDLVRPDGSIMAKNALWIRGTLDTEHGLIQYQVPVWPEALKDDPDTMKQFAKESLLITIRGHVRRIEFEHLHN